MLSVNNTNFCPQMNTPNFKANIKPNALTKEVKHITTCVSREEPPHSHITYFYKGKPDVPPVKEPQVAAPTIMDIANTDLKTLVEEAQKEMKESNLAELTDEQLKNITEMKHRARLYGPHITYFYKGKPDVPPVKEPQVAAPTIMDIANTDLKTLVEEAQKEMKESNLAELTDEQLKNITEMKHRARLYGPHITYFYKGKPDVPPVKEPTADAPTIMDIIDKKL